MVRLIVRQQHIPKVPLQVLFPHLLVAIDGRSLLVGTNPWHVHTVYEINNGENLLRLHGASVGVHCSHEPLAFIFNVTWWILAAHSLRLLSQELSDALAFNSAASVTALPVRDVPLAGAQDDGSVLLPSHCITPFFAVVP